MSIRKQLFFSFVGSIVITTFLVFTLYMYMWFDEHQTILLTLSSFVASMITMIIAITFSVPTIKKLEKLNQKTLKVADGNFDVKKLDIHSPTELKQLSQSFDQMVDKINHQMTQIKNEEHEKINMVQNLAHDLKTPLASIKSYSEGLKDGVIKSEEDKAKAYATLMKQADHLSQMFDDLTDVMTLSTIDHQRVHMRTDQLLIPILEAYERRMHCEGRNFEVEIDSTIKSFYQDNIALDRIIRNFIDNALKFSEKGTPIGVTVTTRDNFIVIAISDQGIGMQQHELKYIFDRTYRIESSRNKDTGGSGLGLYIAKTLATQIDGKIDIHSEYGKGTTISVSFPYK